MCKDVYRGAEMETKHGWFSVVDRLPELRKLVLVATGDSRDPVREGFYNGDRWCIGEAYYRGGMKAPVTHWMPLPEPPERLAVEEGTR
jgi:hypothetical protein